MEKIFILNGKEIKVQEYKASAEEVSFKFAGKAYCFSLLSNAGTELSIMGDSRFKAAVGTPNKEGELMVIADGAEALVLTGGKKLKKGTSHAGGLTSPMPGKIFKVIKEAGSSVMKGEVILILEAMKMEHAIRADKDGKVKAIHYKVGELVQGGVVLADLE
jgi:biotin carboxyl carrier protein